MQSERGRGRLVGGLTFLQLVGLIVPFVLLLPIVTPPGAYLADAAASSTRVLAGVLLLVVNGAVTIGISIAAWPALRRRSEALALWLVVLGGCRKVAGRDYIMEKGLIQYQGSLEEIWQNEEIVKKYLVV